MSRPCIVFRRACSRQIRRLVFRRGGNRSWVAAGIHRNHRDGNPRNHPSRQTVADAEQI